MLDPNAKGTAVKHDQGKPMMSLLSSRWLVGVAKVLTFGAAKYKSHNWRKGHQASRLLDAALRHLTAFMDGEDNDPESGLSHLHHASCCIMFLAENMELRPEFDDRWKPNLEERRTTFPHTAFPPPSISLESMRNLP
jgi:hypothetical protein